MTVAAPMRSQFAGRPASPGLARGPLVVLAEPMRRSASAGTPDAEAARLRQAVAAAAAEIADLVASQDDAEAAAILEFQLALAEDEALTEPVLAAIADGGSALSAWTDALAAMAAEYRDADDEYFRARSADIDDLGGRVAGHLSGVPTGAIDLPPGAVLLARDLTPSRFLATDWSKGRAIALTEGSPTAHVAILARARGVPMAVGFGAVPAGGHAEAILDAGGGRLLLSPDRADVAAFADSALAADAVRAVEDGLLRRPAVTVDGVAVKVMVNAGDPAEIEALDPAVCDGIGLVRSEFLFHGRHGLPGEDEQREAYGRLLRWAAGRPVVVRTLDAGGDKPIPGLTREESNPFLGLRGIRLSLARPEIFRVQVRALLRAAPDGDLLVMAPMVALPQEMTAVRRLFGEEAAALAAAGIAHRMPKLGMMVEVPAAALTLDLFDVDFVSIGSNDLVQYVMAASRDATGLSGLDDAGAPAVQRLIATVIDAGRALNLPVSLCGDAGSDPAVLPQLLRAGLTSVSVAPAAVGRVKRVVSETRAEAGR